MFINNRIDKQVMMYLYNEIPFGNENEQIIPTCILMEESYKMLNKNLLTEDSIQYDYISVMFKNMQN